MPQYRNVTSDGEEPGCEEGMEPVDNPHIEIGMLSTPPTGSVWRNRSSWRSLNRSAVAGQCASEIRISCRVVPRPRRCHQLQNRRNCGRFVPALTISRATISVGGHDPSR
jgi:hypothetical protein